MPGTRPPLEHVRILVTRPEDQAQALVGPLRHHGAVVAFQPAITIGPPVDWGEVDTTCRRLASFDWVVFSSVNGVRYFLDRLQLIDGNVRRLAGHRLAAIGPATAGALADHGLAATVLPTSYRAEALAEELARSAAGSRFLLIRASRGREVLAQRLAAAGGVVEQVVAYSSEDTRQPRPDIAEALAAGRIDWITVTSSAIARSLVAMFGPLLRESRLASISPITSKVLAELGYPAAAEAVEYTMAGVVESIVAAEREKA